MNRIHGKIVIITGATAGIGRACAHTLADKGARIVLIARREARLGALAEEIRENSDTSVHTHVLDVRDRAGVGRFMDFLETEQLLPDVLINNAGLARGLSPVQSGSHEDWDEMIDTNVKGVLNMTRSVLPGMIARDSGQIVNIGSIAGHIVYPNGNVYNATKFAVKALTEATNIDLIGTKVRVSSVDPGLVETEFSLVRFRGDSERAEKVYHGVDSLLPEDIADAVAYVVNTPDHVNVLDMVVLPTVQRSPYVMARDAD